MTTSTQTLRVPDPEERPTLPVWPDAGNFLGLSKASTYDAVTRGEIPVIRIGRRLLVPTAALRRLLGLDESAA
jgi:excisionase family DNA binding protein